MTKLVFCSECNRTLEYDEEPTPKYCDMCGSYVTTECPGCKKPIVNSDARHCRYCGESYILDQDDGIA
jgi:RNA polymerase subunit RPABC4/transcription elongation factor Spt4